jgi:phosphatidylglycerol:prolipoprotein diacylglycerol transferase
MPLARKQIRSSSRQGKTAMELMAIPFPGIDPVAIAIGPLQVRWYGLAYLAGLVLGWRYMRRLLGQPALWRGAPPMKPDQADDFLLWATLGTVLGGRLGYVFFYEPAVFLADPVRIFAVWNGGMSFHGGLLGVISAILLFARGNGVPFLTLGDLAAAAVPFGLFFGRIANFINGEVYGDLTTMPWGVDFPPEVLSPGDAPGPRHPSQLYEAFLEGIVLFLILRYLTHSRHAFSRPGLISGVFLSGYALARITAECFRQWDHSLFFTTNYFSNGMVYSLPMLAVGFYLILRARRDGNEARAAQAGGGESRSAPV